MSSKTLPQDNVNGQSDIKSELDEFDESYDDDEDDELDDLLDDDDVDVDAVEVDNDPNCMYGLDGYKWSIYPSKMPASTKTSEIFPELKGASKTSTFSDAAQVWSLLFTDAMLDEIILATNKEIERKRKSNDSKIMPNLTDITEMKAFFGLLYLVGAYKNANEDMKDLYAQDGTGRGIFGATMSYNRFKFICAHFRFDSNFGEDQIYSILKIYDTFFENSRANFIPGEYLTVDHIATNYKGHSPLMPTEETRIHGHSHGIKLFFVTDSMTNYVLNGLMLGDLIPPDLRQFSLPTQVMLQMVTPLQIRDRNITAGTWFTSIELAYELQSREITYVGTMARKQRQIPREFIFNIKRRNIGSSMYAFNGQTTLVSFVSQKNCPIVIMSTLHHSPQVETGKPEIYNFYEASKTGIAVSEKEASIRAVLKTNRWQVELLYMLLDFAGINTHQIYQMDVDEMKSRNFIIALGRALIQPELVRRSKQIGLNRELRETIARVRGVEHEPWPCLGEAEAKAGNPRRRKRCHNCKHINKERKVATFCASCDKPTCKACMKPCCKNCFNESILQSG